ncbi:MAG: hypothetical protein ACK4VI_06630 [Alphaproteobacteria bacterium]
MNKVQKISSAAVSLTAVFMISNIGWGVVKAGEARQGFKEINNAQALLLFPGGIDELSVQGDWQSQVDEAWQHSDFKNIGMTSFKSFDVRLIHQNPLSCGLTAVFAPTEVQTINFSVTDSKGQERFFSTKLCENSIQGSRLSGNYKEWLPIEGRSVNADFDPANFRLGQIERDM